MNENRYFGYRSFEPEYETMKEIMTPLFAEGKPFVSDCVELNLRRGQVAAFRLDRP